MINIFSESKKILIIGSYHKEYQFQIEYINEIKPYHKKETEPKIVQEVIYKENGVILKEKKIINYI